MAISMPQRPRSNNASLLALAGAGGGAALGGPAGAGLGMGLGSTLGGMQQQPQGPESLQTSQNAMQRRQMAMDESPQRQIIESIDSLKYVEDPAQRVELAKPLLQAEYLMKQKGGYG